MVPSYYIQLEQFPVSPNNKIDRRLLPDPVLAEAQMTNGSLEGDWERLVGAIWQKVLKVPRLERDTHFFQSGGHSLRAMEVAAELHSMLGVEVPLTVIFEHPLLKDLARAVESLAAYECE